MSLKEVMSMDQYSPSKWGAEVNYDNWRKKEKTSQVFLHWTGDSSLKDSPAADGNVNSEKALLRKYERGHLNRGWKGLAYDWAIGQSGTLYRIRGLGMSAATSGDVDEDGFSNNREGEAILILTGPGVVMTDMAEAMLTKVLDALDYKEIYGHRDAKGTPTQCPGENISLWLNDYLEPTTPTITPTKSTKKEEDVILESLGVLRKGVRGNNVIRLQALLNATRFVSLKEDGIYGPLTEMAVVEYQERFRLVVDGIAGPQTWTHLLTSK